MNHHGSTLSTPHSSASATTRHTNSDDRYDEIIENEVCNRLIRLSCDKMVNSKHERGGAKLHRNLLILHLLRRARDEQKRSAPPSLNTSVVYAEMNGSSHYPYGHHAHQITTQVVIESSSHRTDDVSVDDDDEEVDVERCDFDSDGPPQLLDLSCRFVFRSSRSALHTLCNGVADAGPIELSVRDDDDIDYSALRLEPLQLPFGTDAIEAEELTDLSKQPPSMLVVPELSPDLCAQLSTSTETPFPGSPSLAFSKIVDSAVQKSSDKCESQSQFDISNEHNSTDDSTIITAPKAKKFALNPSSSSSDTDGEENELESQNSAGTDSNDSPPSSFEISEDELELEIGSSSSSSSSDDSCCEDDGYYYSDGEYDENDYKDVADARQNDHHHDGQMAENACASPFCGASECSTPPPFGRQISPNSRRKRRKRKTSTSPRSSLMSSSAPPSCPRAKKCCTGDGQLTGLISVFESGLSVMADQLMQHAHQHGGRHSHARDCMHHARHHRHHHRHHNESSSVLQQSSVIEGADQLVPSLIRIACNPLICQ